jgi:hypothetical protein
MILLSRVEVLLPLILVSRVADQHLFNTSMQWSKRGAHLLLQTRVKTLNRELGAVFKRWYPDLEVEELAEAA